MGYTRQATALGLVLIGLTHQENGRYLKNISYIIIACLFHKTAIFGLIFALGKYKSRVNRCFSLVVVAVVALTIYFLILADSTEYFYSTYINSEYRSSGASVRSLMNAIPAIAFLFYRNKVAISPQSKILWTRIALFSLILSVIILFAPGHSTMLDRLGIYLMPIQLYVFSRLPDMFGSYGKRNLGWVLILIFYYALALFVWFNFSDHANAWVPYRFYPLL